MPPLPLPEKLAEDYPQHLRSRIAELGFKEVDYSSITHDRIMEKATKRQKPFKDGGSGYQDCLLWEIILQNIVKESDVTYFVTKNHKDFAAEDKQTLHSDLLEDMRVRGISETCVRYIPDLITLIDSLIMPDMPAVESDEKLSALEKRLIEDDILRDWISENTDKIMAKLNKSRIDSDGVVQESEVSLDGVIREAETVYVSNLEYPESFEIDSISAIDDKTAVVIGTTSIDSNLTFTLFRNEYMILDPPYPFSVISGEWNDHYIFAETEVQLSLRFVFSVSLETDEVLDFEVEDETQLWGYCKRCGAIQYSDAAETCRSCKRRFF